LPAGYRWEHYSPATHALFARAVLDTYEQSLDCPAISGLRDIDDVIAGHRATGEFDPSLWFAVCFGEDPAGVLILSPAQHGQMLELVYVGLVPAYRGRGLGDLLMRKALETAAERGAASLSLAVDAANKPALNLYWRHGLRTVGRKNAMMRDLR
jgi:ribosomal protein S18 acetylase RimI-like enzyme